MNLEHAGGAPESALESDTRRSSHVGVIQSDVNGLDSPRDRIFEAVYSGNWAGVLDVMQGESEKHAVEAIVRLCDIIQRERRPRLAIAQLSWITGMSAADGKTVSELAKIHGVSKQAFQQGAAKLMKRLALRKSTHLRSEEARKNMSAANKRNTKIT